MRPSWNSLIAATCLAGGLIALATVTGNLPAQEPSEPQITESGIVETKDTKPEGSKAEVSESGILKAKNPKPEVSVSKEGLKLLGAPEADAKLLDEAAKNAQTLDDVRKLYRPGDKVPMRAVIETRIKSRLVDTLHNDITMKPAKPVLLTTSEAKRTLDRLRSRLRSAKGQAGKSDPEAEKVELDRALNNYFLSDMKARVSELDKIKARVKELEDQLERRMKAKNEIIELQKKVLLSEVDGLGFFAPDDRDEENVDISLDISESEEDEPSLDENPNAVSHSRRTNRGNKRSPDAAPETGLQKF